MPLVWKIINIFIVVIPKLVLWFCVVSVGTLLLLETSGIMDVIINSMSLTFILNIDEMIFDRLVTTATKHIVTSLEDYPLYAHAMNHDRGGISVGVSRSVLSRASWK